MSNKAISEISKLNWYEIETNHSALGIEPAGSNSPDLDAYRARHSSNFYKAEAIVITKPVDNLQAIRTYMARGKFQIAEAMLKEDSAQDNASEKSLEMARLAAFKRDWASCGWHSSIGLNDDKVSGITRYYLLQVWSVALYELGQFEKALEQLSKMESLGELYPFASADNYANALRIKIIARVQSLEVARDYLDRLWNKTLEKPNITLGHILTLFRLELDIKRASLTDYTNEAKACYLVSQSMGDDLYKSYALVDLLSAQGIIPEPSLYEDRQYGQSIKNLISEITHVSSVSGTCINKYINKRQSLRSYSQVYYTEQSLDSYKFILFLQKNVLINLESRTVMPNCFGPKQIQALISLSKAEVTKERLFHDVWGEQKYTPRLHDNGIRVLLSSIRKKSGIKINSENKMLKIVESLVVCTKSY